MIEPERDDSIQVLRALPTTWATKNPILREGEYGYEKITGNFKIGNGHSRWLDLDYFIPEASVREAIQSAISVALANLPQGPDASDIVALTAHINSQTPHPVYDDGTSFLLLYQNAKV